MKYLSACIAISFFGLIANTVHALDFYGANISDRDVPSSFMKVGIYGIRPTITDISYDTFAEKAGFKMGDIILSINDKQTKRASDFNLVTADILNVLVVRGNERKILSVNRFAIETAKAARIEIEREATVSRQQLNKEEQQENNFPAIRFDDVALERKFGKSKPTDLAGQKRAEVNKKLSDEKRALFIKMNDKGGCYKCDFSGADLAGIYMFDRGEYSSADFRNCNFSGANMEGMTMNRSNLSGSNLSNANLRGVTMFQASLVHANLNGADCTGASMSYGTDFRGANISGTILDKTKIWNAVWVDGSTCEVRMPNGECFSYNFKSRSLEKDK